MPMLIDSPSGGPPPELMRTIGLWMATALVVGVPVYVLMMRWRRRETAQDAIPEASARAQVEAAHRREQAMA